MRLLPEEYLKAVPPMPVVLLCTVHNDVMNAAPFAWITPVSMAPPLLSAAVRKTRDTFKNIVDTGEFVISVPGPDLLNKVKKAAFSYPRDVSEFDMAGLTPEKSEHVEPAGIAECWANIECRLEWMKEAGDHHIVVGRVVGVNVSDDVPAEDFDLRTPDSILHHGGGRDRFASVGDDLE